MEQMAKLRHRVWLLSTLPVPSARREMQVCCDCVISGFHLSLSVSQSLNLCTKSSRPDEGAISRGNFQILVYPNTPPVAALDRRTSASRSTQKTL